MSFNAQLINLLKSNSRFIDEDNELILAAVQDAAWKINHDLVRLLLSNTDMKEMFFSEIDGHWLFELNIFLDYVAQKNFLDNSYTRFKNRIGLTIDDKYLRQRGEVALAWPYKDCVLEGGQTKDEEKRKEIFFNETLAQDEISRLFDPKVLTNFKRYTTEGEELVTDFHRDENGTIQENLIIKGNNLLALHTLQKQFWGKVKLIYIDPPYNTDSDSFKYNDSFNQSSWLTFMLNRFQVAKNLLHKSGVIFVQINDHNQNYLKILMDEVFGRDNFINLIAVRTKSPSGFKTVNLGLFETAEYILMYGHSKNNFKYNPQYVASGYDDNYTGYITNINDSPEKWIVDDSRKIICREEGVDPELTHHPYSEVKKKIGESLYFQKISSFALNNAKSVFRLTAIGNDAGKETLTAKKKSKNNPTVVFEVKRRGGESRFLLNGQQLSFYSKKIKNIDGKDVPTTILTNIWTDIAYEGIASEGGVTLKKGKKPEKLLKRIIEMSTDEHDLVLDFFGGAGTTGAVAHKMNRQYILVEQMDYIHDLPESRLKRVVHGEQSGISKAVNWQGGGDFIYCELMPYNQIYMDKIQTAITSNELVQLWRNMAENSFLNWYVNPEIPDEAINDFIAIGQEKDGLEKQKRLLAALLDKNQLYVNLTEIEDAQFDVNKANIALNKMFYGEAYNG